VDLLRRSGRERPGTTGYCEMDLRVIARFRIHRLGRRGKEHPTVEE
jgi:hypothetical protein